MKTKLEIGNLSDVGKKRAVNEDYFGSYKGKYGTLIIVCDGMGGNKGGAIASRLAVETIKEHFEKLPAVFDAKHELRSSLLAADFALKTKSNESPDLKEMGSTAVILLIKDDMAFTAHIGDSRIYLVRKKEIHKITKDHSLVQQMIDANIITEEAAEEHPNKNVITRSLGADGSSEPEIAEPFSVFKNDIFILCTDGLTTYLNNNELLQITLSSSPQDSCGKLIHIANERGGKDNITVQVVFIKNGKHFPVSGFFNKKAIRLLSVFILALLIFISIVYYVFFTAPPDDLGKENKVSPDSTYSETKKDTNEGISLPLKKDSTNIKTGVLEKLSNEKVNDSTSQNIKNKIRK